MKWLPFICIIAIIIVLKLAEALINKNKQIDYSQSYQARYLLTKNELNEYAKLQQLAKEKDLLICPKVRLLDVIEPKKGKKSYLTLLNKVKSKHLDFVICDKNMQIKAILEIDDSSHNRKDRQERDAFVDLILTSVGYKIIHTRAITESTLEDISAILRTTPPYA